MSAYLTRWRTLLVGLCILGLIPITSMAQNDYDEERYKKSPQEVLEDELDSKKSPPKQPKRLKQTEQGNSLKDRIRQQTLPQQEQRQLKQRERPDRDKSLKERTRYQTQPRREQQQLEQRKRSDWGESLKERSRYQTLPRQEQQQLERRNQSVRDQPSRTAPPRLPRSSHDRYYKQYSDQLKRDRHYRRHETYRYHTHYLAPIKRHYLPLYYRVRVLPHTYVRIVVHSLPYFYFDGIFYRHYIGGGYIVVRAPIGAVVHVLPVGFIAFSLGAFIYYYANDTYYLWDDEREAYIVVEKPDGAEAALAEATEGRIFAYPSQGQSEEQQARDRYECHRWAVTETRADPTLDDENNLSYEDKRNYKRAISACLEGRGYTVK